MIVGFIKSILGKDAKPSCCAVEGKARDVLHVDTSSCETHVEEMSSGCCGGMAKKAEEEKKQAQGGCCGGGCH